MSTALKKLFRDGLSLNATLAMHSQFSYSRKGKIEPLEAFVCFQEPDELRIILAGIRSQSYGKLKETRLSVRAELAMTLSNSSSGWHIRSFSCRSL